MKKLWDKDLAKSAIMNYIINEWGEDYYYHADPNEPLPDHGEIPLAYTTLTDYEIPIQVSVNIDTMELVTYINDSDTPTDTTSIDIEFLEDMDFDSLIYGWETWIEDNILPDMIRDN